MRFAAFRLLRVNIIPERSKPRTSPRAQLFVADKIACVDLILLFSYTEQMSIERMEAQPNKNECLL